MLHTISVHTLRGILFEEKYKHQKPLYQDTRRGRHQAHRHPFVNNADARWIIIMIPKQRSLAASLYKGINLGIITQHQKSQIFISLNKPFKFFVSFNTNLYII